MKTAIQLINDPYTKDIKIKELLPGITKQDIKKELENYKIINGVHWDNISDAIEAVNKTGKATTEIIIKSGYGPTIRIIEDNNSIKEIEGKEFEEVYSNIYTALISKKKDITIESGSFIKKGKLFLTTENNINNKPLLMDNTISYDIVSNHIEYYANTSGYLALKNRVLTIVDPITINTDKTTKYYIVAPVKYGEDDLIKDFKTVDYKNKDIKRFLDSNKKALVVLKESKKMKPGRNGSIKFLEGKNKEANYNNNFREVQKGEIIAEKIEAIQGVDGSDINGNIIKSSRVTDVKLDIGENIDSFFAKSENITFYKAAIDGVLYTTPHFITVAKDLIVKSNVNMETGNIKYDGDIYILGTVNSGFSVKCGGNLSVKGSVENGAEIFCYGNVNIEKGIIGHNTKFYSDKDTKADFIQEADIKINGDLNIESYIYNSNVFARGNIIVKGKKIKGESHGSVIGSNITSMENINLHSAGSISSRTVISCGVDYEVMEGIRTIKGVVPVIDRKLMHLQYSIGFDLTKKDAKEKLLKLPPVEKKLVINKLTKLKEIIHQKDELLKKQKELEVREYSYDLQNLSIVIQKFIKSGAEIVIGKLKKRISVDTRNVTFKIQGNHIFEESN